MVSQKFCEKLVALGAHRRYRITVVGEESKVAYDRVHLTDYFTTGDFKTIRLATASWYEKNGIELVLNERISKIDGARKVASTANSLALPYDKLVLVTGSSPFVPPIPGAGNEGVFVYRTVDDVDRIREYAKQARHATILGGGLLGLEAANALKNQNLDTHVIELANGLMPRQLNEEGSFALERQLKKLGLTIHLGKGIQEIERRESGLLLRLSDGSSLATDTLILSAGIRPRDELAASANLTTGARGGIQVNDSLQTSDPDIYAIGECALHRGQIYGLVAPGYQMAEALASVLMGQDARYTGSELSCRLKLLGVEVSALGDYLGQGKTLIYRSPEAFRMLVLKRDRLEGATAVGDWNQASQLQMAIQDKLFLSPSDQQTFVSEGTLPVSDSPANWPANAIVCNCTQTTKGAITACIERGCRKVDELSQATGAGSVCGSCRPLIAQLAGAGAEEAVYTPKGRKLLWASAAIATAAATALFLAPPLPAPQTVQDFYYSITKLWTDGLYKQITGYSIAGLSFLALTLSARKRIRFARKGNFGWWRAAHAILGCACVLGLVAHTGFSLGENLNRWLMISFLALNALGGMAGVTLAMEDRLSGARGRWFRSLLTKSHIFFFWPYPVLLGFHIFKVYYY